MLKKYSPISGIGILLVAMVLPAFAGPSDPIYAYSSLSRKTLTKKTFKQYLQELHHRRKSEKGMNVQVGPRPYYLVEDMDEGKLKRKLSSCSEGPFYKSDFSIGHRGAPLQFPEHTAESYEAAARMGAGIIECDVTFTADEELVCRHSQCDLHTTTDILAVPELAAKCTEGFVPYDPSTGKAASAKCCTSDITLAEFKTLCGKMDASFSKALSTQEYLGGTANFRTDLYSTCGTVLSHAESIELFKELEVKFTPELKAPSVPMPFNGSYTQEDYAQQMIEEYKAARIPAKHVFPQSFNLDDVKYWIRHEPSFGKQGVYLDDRVDAPGGYATAVAGMGDLRKYGVRIVAPPMWALLKLNPEGKIIPSEYAVAAKSAGLEIITWTLERSGLLKNQGGYYYQSVTAAIDNDGDMLEVLDILATQVGVKGIFSDWPGTVSYYANCMGR
jgi:glycerophosphoryl diester phosphodiesterase